MGLTQRGGEHNALFLNPTYLIDSKSTQGEIETDILNSSLIMDKQSFDFLKELNGADSNQEISKLLKANIGKTLSILAHNFSSIYQTNDASHNPLSYSLGIANTLDGYFITHSGFGSKRAMETSMEKNQALVGTVVLKQDNWHYGLNLKVIKKYQTIYNYAINEMAKQGSVWDYFDNIHTQKKLALGLDMGVSYDVPNNGLNSKLSLALLDIGDTSFNTLGADKQSMTIGFSFEPKDTHIKVDYVDGHLRTDIGKKFFNQTLEVHSGIIHNALSLGVNYKFSLFNIGLFSYKIKEYSHKEERKTELYMAVIW